jgi:hypothetical protein
VLCHAVNPVRHIRAVQTDPVWQQLGGVPQAEQTNEWYQQLHRSAVHNSKKKQNCSTDDVFYTVVTLIAIQKAIESIDKLPSAMKNTTREM